MPREGIQHARIDNDGVRGMVHTTVHLKEEQYQYLAEQAAATQRSVEDVLSEIVEADIAWRQTLASDPVAQLFGAVSDEPNLDIDEIVYELNDTQPGTTNAANNPNPPH